MKFFVFPFAFLLFTGFDLHRLKHQNIVLLNFQIKQVRK